MRALADLLAYPFPKRRRVTRCRPHSDAVLASGTASKTPAVAMVYLLDAPPGGLSELERSLNAFSGWRRRDGTHQRYGPDMTFPGITGIDLAGAA